MFFTYSPCWFCGVLNHLYVDLGTTDPSICKFCCRELPLWRGLNMISGHGLQALVEGSRMPVLAAFSDAERRFALERDLGRLVERLGPEIVFAVVELTGSPGLQDFYRVEKFPTFVMFYGNREQGRCVGRWAERGLADWLCNATALNVA